MLRVVYRYRVCWSAVTRSCVLPVFVQHQRTKGLEKVLRSATKGRKTVCFSFSHSASAYR